MKPWRMVYFVTGIVMLSVFLIPTTNAQDLLIKKPRLREVWKIETGDIDPDGNQSFVTFGKPVVHDDKLYVSADRNMLIINPRSGEILNKIEMQGLTDRYWIINNHLIYIFFYECVSKDCKNAKVYICNCIDLDSGVRTWSQKYFEGWVDSIVIGDTLYFITTTFLDSVRFDGIKGWKKYFNFNGDKGEHLSSIFYSGKTIYIKTSGFSYGQIYCLNIETQSEIWTKTINQTSKIRYVNENGCFVEIGGEVIQYNSKTGKEVANYGKCFGFLIDDGKLYKSDACIDMKSKKTLWSIQRDYLRTNNAIYNLGNYLLLLNSMNGFVTIDKASGIELWKSGVSGSPSFSDWGSYIYLLCSRQKRITKSEPDGRKVILNFVETYLACFTDAASHLEFTAEAKIFKIDGETVPVTIQPKIIQGSMLVTLKDFVKPLGGRVYWSSDSDVYYATLYGKADKVLKFNPMTRSIIVNNTTVSLRIQNIPLEYEDEIMLPIETLCDIFDCKLEYNKEKGIASITYIGD